MHRGRQHWGRQHWVRPHWGRQHWGRWPARRSRHRRLRRWSGLGSTVLFTFSGQGRAGEVRYVCLWVAAGSGKTTLLAAWVRRLRREGESVT